MSNSDNYIKLPCLKSISVNNYALFKEDWTYEVKNGLNLFLGANGLGKTTTANLIIYGIVGAWQDENDNLHESYFTEREHEALKDHYKNQEPTVTISFKVAASSFSVERYLSNPEIKQFSINGELFNKVDTQNICDVYVDKLKGCCLLDNIEDLSFILRKLLIREEEGNYLMWDRVDQSKIIRLLFNPPGFFKDFLELEKQTTSALSAANRLRDFRGQFEKRKKAIEGLRDSIANKLTAGSSILELKSKLEDQILKIGTIQEEKDKLLEDISYMQNELRELEQSENTLSLESDTINDDLSQREKDFFGSIYHNPRMQLITHKLDRNHTCIVCNNSKIKPDKVDIILNKINIQHHCPVCNESIRIESDNDIGPNEEDLNKLVLLRKKSKEKSSHLNVLIMKKKNIERPLSDLWKKNSAVEKQLNEYKLLRFDLELAISKVEGKSDYSSQYDRDILVLQKEIDNYNSEIGKEDIKYHKKKVLLENKNSKLNQRIDNISNKLNDVFSRYSKHFHLKDLRLTTSERQQRESKVKLTSFCPFFNDKTRMSIKQVSKSESIFLEYLFRIALVELFYHESNSLPFLILETSEGAFDLARTKQLASVLNAFCNNPFPYISITNLSKPQFVEVLLTKIDSPRERLFNFIDYGAHEEVLEEQQKAELALFKEELIKLGLKDADSNQ